MSTNRDHLLLDLWKPPSGSGGAIGCLASTFNFSPTLFEEECLARFLEVDAAPNHEELAFLIEREHRLGEVYAGVLVDYSHAGVGHSFRWDIMPVRVHKAIQHSKVSLLVWANHVRIIIASTNLTEAGYRTNREVAVSLDLQPQASDRTMLTSVLTFLRRVVSHSLGFRMNDDKDQLPSIQRALSFLSNVEHRAEGWVDKPPNHRVRQFFVSTFPESSDLEPASSSLDQAIDHCRKRGNSPHIIWIASPFYDDHFDTVSSICRSMARGSDRSLVFCVPCSHDDEADMALINAPKLLADTPRNTRHPTDRLKVLSKLHEKIEELDRSLNGLYKPIRQALFQNSLITHMAIEQVEEAMDALRTHWRSVIREAKDPRENWLDPSEQTSGRNGPEPIREIGGEHE